MRIWVQNITHRICECTPPPQRFSELSSQTQMCACICVLLLVTSDENDVLVLHVFPLFFFFEFRLLSIADFPRQYLCSTYTASPSLVCQASTSEQNFIETNPNSWCDFLHTFITEGAAMLLSDILRSWLLFSCLFFLPQMEVVEMNTRALKNGKLFK